MAKEEESSKKVVFILGAGFSKCAGVPIQAEFSPLLTDAAFDTPFDVEVSNIIKAFLQNVFSWKEGREIPSLEDVFTFLDISVHQDHFLGCAYTPPMLKALRKILIYRIFQILDNEFRICPEINQLLDFYKHNDCAYLVMNWDIVLEKHLLDLHPSVYVNYITPSYDWNSQRSGNPGHGTKICKMHGSSNWMYCRNCKAIFYQIDQKLSLHKKVGLQKEDFRLFNKAFADEYFKEAGRPTADDNHCQVCHNVLSSHIATFSYRKSLRTAAYSAIWHEAEKLLADADKWVFIGYSLPEADFELKHLIKSAELRKPEAGTKEIKAVLFQDEYARDKFNRFFGQEKVEVFDNGLTEYLNSLKNK